MGISKLMHLCGYKSDPEGVCFGVANMAMQAILAEDTATFDKRNEIIFGMPEEELPNYIAALRDEWKKNKLANKPNINDLKHEIPAYFDGIELYYAPNLYPNVFEKDEQPTTQDTVLTLPILMSKKLMEKEGVSELDEFKNVYQKNDLITYFDEIKKAFTKYGKPFALILGSVNHSITVGYDPKRKEWLFVNPANLSPGPSIKRIKIKDTKTLTKHVLSALSNNDVTVFSTNIYVTNNNFKEFDQAVKNLKTQKSWENIHKFTAKKAILSDSKKTTWLGFLLSYRDSHNNIDTVNLIKKLILSVPTESAAIFNEILANGQGLLHLAIAGGNKEIINLLLNIPNSDVNVKNKKGQTPLYLAIQFRNAEAINELLQHKKINPNIADEDGLTPLIIAAKQGNADLVRDLLKAGADPNQIPPNKESALFYAVLHGDKKLVQALLNFHAYPVVPFTTTPKELRQIAKKYRIEKSMEEYIDKESKFSKNGLISIKPKKIASMMKLSEISNLLKHQDYLKSFSFFKKTNDAQYPSQGPHKTTQLKK